MNNFSVILGPKAILSRTLIIQAKMLYEQFIHHMKINLSQNTHFFIVYSSVLNSHFELFPGLIPFVLLWLAG